MDEHESSSSTGLIIGVVLGVVVVVLLVLGGLGATMWLFVAETAREEAAVMHEANMAAHDHDEAVKDLEAAVKELLEAHRKRLIGVWEAKTFDDGEVTLEFQEDGAMHLTAKRPGAPKELQTKGRWEVLEAKGDQVKLRRTAADNTDAVQDIRFEGDNRFTILGPRGGAVYTRRVK